MFLADRMVVNGNLVCIPKLTMLIIPWWIFEYYLVSWTNNLFFNINLNVVIRDFKIKNFLQIKWSRWIVILCIFRNGETDDINHTKVNLWILLGKLNYFYILCILVLFNYQRYILGWAFVNLTLVLEIYHWWDGVEVIA